MQSKGLSRVFSNTTVQKRPFFGTENRRGRKETEVARRIKGGSEKEGDRFSQ